MTDEEKIIDSLKKIGSSPLNSGEKKFLDNLRIKLSNHILEHSLAYAKSNQSVTLNIKWLESLINNAITVARAIIMPQKLASAILIIFILGIGTIAVASQNSLPGETLYPVKILSEEMRSSLALTPESKARVQSDFVTRRVAEVKAIMDQNDVNPEILNTALANLQKNTDDATAIIDKESQKGVNVAKLAKDINDTLDKNTEDLKQIFDDKKNNLKKEETALKDKIVEAKKTNDQGSIAALNTKLNETKDARKSFESSLNQSEEVIQKNNLAIENQMAENEKQLAKKSNAEKTIAEAKKGKQTLLSEARDKGITPAPDIFAEFDAALSKAEETYAQEKYDDAENIAREALSKLKNIEYKIDYSENGSGENNGIVKPLEKKVGALSDKNSKKITNNRRGERETKRNQDNPINRNRENIYITPSPAPIPATVPMPTQEPSLSPTPIPTATPATTPEQTSTEQTSTTTPTPMPSPNPTPGPTTITTTPSPRPSPTPRLSNSEYND